MLDQVRLIKDQQIDEALRTRRRSRNRKKVVEAAQTYYQTTGQRRPERRGRTPALGLTGGAIVAGDRRHGAQRRWRRHQPHPRGQRRGARASAARPHVNAHARRQERANGAEQGGRRRQGHRQHPADGRRDDRDDRQLTTAAPRSGTFRRRLADKELPQIDKQIAAADIRHQIADAGARQPRQADRERARRRTSTCAPSSPTRSSTTGWSSSSRPSTSRATSWPTTWPSGPSAASATSSA